MHCTCQGRIFCTYLCIFTRLLCWYICCPCTYPSWVMVVWCIYNWDRSQSSQRIHTTRRAGEGVILIKMETVLPVDHTSVGLLLGTTTISVPQLGWLCVTYVCTACVTIASLKMHIVCTNIYSHGNIFERSRCK